MHGLSIKYKQIAKFNLGIKIDTAIAFVPSHDILKIFEKLMNLFWNKNADKSLILFLSQFFGNFKENILYKGTKEDRKLFYL